jgi:predicted metal-dependent phosphoesterase TrpH
MGYADLHIHTIHSWDGTCAVSAVLKYVKDKTDLDLIAITDHDEIAGALIALEIAPHFGVQVIPGCEISTAEGNLLALDITERVPAGLPLIETVLRVAALGGYCIAAHPNALVNTALSSASIRRALADPEAAQTLIGIETFNAGLIYTASNCQSAELAKETGVAAVGNSDSHVLQTIGRGATVFLGQTPADVKHALQARRTYVRDGLAARPAEIISRWLPRYMLRSLGWVTASRGPEDPLHLRRLAVAENVFS